MQFDNVQCIHFNSTHRKHCFAFYFYPFSLLNPTVVDLAAAIFYSSKYYLCELVKTKNEIFASVQL